MKGFWLRFRLRLLDRRYAAVMDDFYHDDLSPPEALRALEKIDRKRRALERKERRRR